MALLRVCVFLLCAVAVAVAAGQSEYVVPPSELSEALYPDWAHDHWVWLSNDQANQVSETDFVMNFINRGIRVGAVDIDSTWSTGINNFIWNTDKYPNASAMIDFFHARGVRVICWVTSVIDTDSSNYQYAKENNYMLNHGQLIKWWHGWGGMLDYTNPAAVEWWHSQMDWVIDIGLDGWKCDGTDPYIYMLGIAKGYAGRVTYREYADDYYGDFYFYTRSKNPDALIMSRPVDSYGPAEEPLYWSFSPRDVVFSGWVGDENPTFYGLRNALRNMLHSAWENYVGFGSDIGGYRCCGSKHGPELPEQGRTKQLFLRWAQMGSVNSLMENGGDNDHGPWQFDNETVDIYRTFVNLHYEIKPYLLNAGSTAYYANVSIMKPLANRTEHVPSTFDWYLWTDIFVSPVLENVTSQKIHFPDDRSCWVDWWNASAVYCGPLDVDYDVPLERYPIFQRQGSILPLDVTTDDSQFGDARSAGALTLAVHLPGVFGHSLREGTVVREWKGPTQEITYTLDDGLLKLVATSHSRSLLVRLANVQAAPSTVTMNGVQLPSADSPHEHDGSWHFDPLAGILWVRTGSTNKGMILSVDWLPL